VGTGMRGVGAESAGKSVCVTRTWLMHGGMCGSRSGRGPATVAGHGWRRPAATWPVCCCSPTCSCWRAGAAFLRARPPNTCVFQHEHFGTQSWARRSLPPSGSAVLWDDGGARGAARPPQGLPLHHTSHGHALSPPPFPVLRRRQKSLGPHHRRRSRHSSARTAEAGECTRVPLSLWPRPAASPTRRASSARAAARPECTPSILRVHAGRGVHVHTCDAPAAEWRPRT